MCMDVECIVATTHCTLTEKKQSMKDVMTTERSWTVLACAQNTRWPAGSGIEANMVRRQNSYETRTQGNAWSSLSCVHGSSACSCLPRVYESRDGQVAYVAQPSILFCTRQQTSSTRTQQQLSSTVVATWPPTVDMQLLDVPATA